MLENGLTIITQNNTHYIDSREVAEIVGKRHNDLLRDIRGYIEIMETMGERKIAHSANGRKNALVELRFSELGHYANGRKSSLNGRTPQN